MNDRYLSSAAILNNLSGHVAAALAADYIVKTFDATTVRALSGSEGEVDLGL